MNLGVAFDFDGVLYDTYWFIPRLLAAEAVGKRVPRELLEHMDDSLEALGVWDRDSVYRVAGLEGLHERIWVSRVAYARPTGVARLLWLLRGLGLRVYIVCGADASVEEKRRRLALYGVDMLVDRVIVYEPGGLRGALRDLILEEGVEKLVYVDDKPSNTCVAASVERVEAVWFVFRPPYPLRHAWRGPHCGATASNPDELLDAILSMLGARDPATPHHGSQLNEVSSTPMAY